MKKNVAKNSGGGRRALPRRADIGERLCVSVPEAAKMIGISRNLAYEMVKQKQLPVIKFGKRLVVPRVALEKRLAELEAGVG